MSDGPDPAIPGALSVDDPIPYALADTDAPRDEPEESNLVTHARRELQLLGEDEDVIEWYLDVVRQFAAFGHSGGSAAATIPVLTRLLQYQQLTELTADPQEWQHIAEAIAGDASTWQSRRNPEAFSTDGGKTYYLLSETTRNGRPRRTHTSKPAGQRGEAGS